MSHPMLRSNSLSYTFLKGEVSDAWDCSRYRLRLSIATTHTVRGSIHKTCLRDNPNPRPSSQGLVNWGSRVSKSATYGHVGYIGAIVPLIDASIFLVWHRCRHGEADENQERELLQELHFGAEKDT